LVLRRHFEFHSLDMREQLSALVFRNSAANRHDLTDGSAQRRIHRAEIESFDVDAAPHCFTLQDVDDVTHLQLVVGDQRYFLAVKLDVGFAMLEVETILDLLSSLIQGVVEFLPIDARNDVERGFARHETYDTPLKG